MGKEGASIMTTDTEHEHDAAYLRSLPYEQYLQTEHWRENVRPAAIERADHRCQLCNGDRGLHVHHNTYDRLGAELPSDVVVLCNQCHWHHHTPRLHTTHTGIACPSCGAEFWLELSVLPSVTE